MKTFLTLVLGIILGAGGIVGAAHLYINSQGGLQAVIQKHAGDALKGQAADKLKGKLGDKIPGGVDGIGDLKSLPKL